MGGRIKANKAEAKRLAEDMKHVEAVLKMFDPEFNARAIAMVGDQMPTPVEVSYIKKRSGDFAPHERVEGYGGVWDYKPWYLLEENVIRWLEKPETKRQWAFWTSIDGEPVPLILAAHDGRKYVTTEKDGAGAPNSLLSLPECPAERYG